MSQKEFSRRKFIKRTLASAVVMGAAPNLFAESKMQDKKIQSVSKPLFRFLQINDLHLQLTEGGGYKDNKARITWLIDALREDKYFPKPDFILGIGDLIHGDGLHGQSLEGIKKDLKYFNEYFLKGLSVPFYPVMGNHECQQKEGNPEYEAPFIQTFGPDSLNYSFEYKGVRFIAFNNSGTYNLPDEQEYARKEKLKELLQSNTSMPQIVCCHIPLIPLREEDVLAKSFGFTSYKTKDASTLDVIQDPRCNVRAVLSGHLHITCSAVKKGIHHISITGLASYPHDIALYSVFNDRIDVEVIRVPSNLLEPVTNIHGARRHNKDFTDNEHPSYSQYIMGNENERRFSIKL